MSCLAILGGVAVLSVVTLFSGCSQPSTPQPLSYSRQYSGNVSTIFGPSGPDRTSDNDPNPPEFYWRTSTGALDSLSGQQGKMVLLNFWAIWCGNCTQEMPGLQSISKQYSTDSLVVIGVDVDDNGDVFSAAKDYVQAHGYTYQMVIDSDYQLYKHYTSKYRYDLHIPQSFLIGADGTIKEYFVGLQSRDVFVQEINKYR